MKFLKERKSLYRRVRASFKKLKLAPQHYYPSIVAGNAIHCLHFKKRSPACPNLSSIDENMRTIAFTKIRLVNYVELLGIEEFIDIISQLQKCFSGFGIWTGQNNRIPAIRIGDNISIQRDTTQIRQYQLFG